MVARVSLHTSPHVHCACKVCTAVSLEPPLRLSSDISAEIAFHSRNMQCPRVPGQHSLLVDHVLPSCVEIHAQLQTGTGFADADADVYVVGCWLII